VAAIPYMQVRKGMVLLGDDGQLYYVVERDLNTPGNWRAILQLKLKCLKTGAVSFRRVHPDDKVEQAQLDRREMQYIYQDGDGFVFMDTETFDQTSLAGDWVGDLMLFLREGDKAQVTFHGELPVSLELPSCVELKVAETEGAVRGAGATMQYKQATLETGLKVSVPEFIKVGETISVDTRKVEYLGRAGK
jgi:elongation factor P